MNTGNAWNRTRRFPTAMLRDSAIGKAIARLPETLRWVMILGERNGLSTTEIANLAGVSPKVIESTQNRGLVLIQKELLIRVGVAS